MDRFGRVPVIASGFALGAVGCWLTALGTWADSALAVVAGFALIGSSAGISLLVRTAAGDMYPPSRRAGISYVLVGAVGAILGPAVFQPDLRRPGRAERERPDDSMARGRVLSLVAMALALSVRPDPKRIGELIAAGDQQGRPHRPLPCARSSAGPE